MCKNQFLYTFHPGSYLVLVDPFQKFEIGEKEEKEEEEEEEKKREKKRKRRERRREVTAN